MGTNYFAKKRAEKRYKQYKEKEIENIDDDRDNKYERVKEYKNFKAKYKFCRGKEIKVEVNELFAVETIYNYTIPHFDDEEYDNEDELIDKDPGIELFIKRSFYPYPGGYCGGDTHHIYLFRGIVPGNHKIYFYSRAINVEVV